MVQLILKPLSYSFDSEFPLWASSYEQEQLDSVVEQIESVTKPQNVAPLRLNSFKMLGVKTLKGDFAGNFLGAILGGPWSFPPSIAIENIAPDAPQD